MGWSLNPKTPSLRGLTILGLGLLCLLVPRGVIGASDPNQVIVNGNVYDNIYIALSPDIPMEQCKEILDDFKAVINEATAILFNLTDSRITFPHLFRVVLPSSFTGCGGYWTSNSTPTGWQYDKAPLRLGTTHPLFGDSIWTRQPGQCGDPGDYIFLTPVSLKDTSLAAHQLVAEWAKYRWGVMEEVGHQGDPLYPPAFDVGSGGQRLPTACSDVPLNYTVANCDTASSCSVTVEPSSNLLVKSSILSLPQLPNVVNLCNATTHNSAAPTKQNVLCSRSSAWETFAEHSDFAVNPAANTPTPTVEVTAVLEAPVVSSIVLVVENTERMTTFSYQREYLLNAACQTIISYLENGVYFGVVYFGDTASSVNESYPMGVLDSAYKHQLCTQLEGALMTPSTSPTLSIEKAMTSASELLPPDGAIVLITMPGGSTESASSVAAAAGSNSVWPVLYPVGPDQEISWFNELAEMTGGGAPQSVAQNLVGSQLHPKVRSDLSRALRNTITLNQQLQLVQTDSETCISNDSTRKCKMTLTRASEPPSGGYLISAYFQSATFVTITPSDTCTEIVYTTRLDTSANFLCNSLNDSLAVEVTTVEDTRTVYSEMIALVQPDVGNTSSVTLWASSSLKNLEYTNRTAPSIFAQVVYEGREVLQAAVSLQVASPARALVTLQLVDDGTGADVTGNDGIYSTFLTGVPSNISHMSSGALSLSATASGPGYFMPEALTLEPPNQCCGSLLSLPSPLKETASFTLTEAAQAKVTSPPPSNLPPGRVTDLTATTRDRSVRLTFSAPGADLNYGTVTSYDIVVSNAEVVVSNAEDVVLTRRVTSGLVTSGLVQTVELDKLDVGCDRLRSYVVTAFDEQNIQSDNSNVARYNISCSAGDADPITAGAITGIVIGIILFLVLLCLIIFIGCNWEEREDLWVWQLLTCVPCRNGDEKLPKKQPQSPKKTSETSGRPPVTKIRSIEDLYAKPDKSRQNQGGTGRATETFRRGGGGVDNNGFDDVPLHGQLSMSASRQGGRRYSGSSISSKEGFDSVPYDLRDSSLQTTLPINRVGIPVPDFTGVPLHEERFQEHPNEFPPYLEQPSYANPFSDPLMDDPYQQPHSDYPSSQFDGYPRHTNLHDSQTYSPSAPSPSRLNTQV